MDKNQKIGLAIGASAVLGGIILAATGKRGSTAPPPPPPGLATVRVTVVDSSKAPIAGATVVFGGSQATTNSSGIVDYTQVEPGEYQLTSSAAGYQPSSQTVHVVEGTSSFTVELTPIAPVTVTAYVTISNYPAGSSYYDIQLVNGTGQSGVRISEQATISGPSQDDLLVEIYDQDGNILFFEPAIPVEVEDGAFYTFDCLTKRLMKEVIPWSILSTQIPAQVPSGEGFMPEAKLKLLNVGYAYTFDCYITYAGQKVRFLAWSFLPPDILNQIPAWAYLYLPLNSPDDTYSIQGDNVGVGSHEQIVGPSTLYYRTSHHRGYAPVPPGTYPIYAEILWAPVFYSEADSDIFTTEPRRTQTVGPIAQIQVV